MACYGSHTVIFQKSMSFTLMACFCFMISMYICMYWLFCVFIFRSHANSVSKCHIWVPRMCFCKIYQTYLQILLRAIWWNYSYVAHESEHMYVCHECTWTFWNYSLIAINKIQISVVVLAIILTQSLFLPNLKLVVIRIHRAFNTIAWCRVYNSTLQINVRFRCNDSHCMEVSRCSFQI